MSKDVMSANMLAYFWETKRDITRDVCYTAEECARRFPRVYDAWKEYLAAEKRMNDAIVEAVANEREEKEEKEEKWNCPIHGPQDDRVCARC